MRRHTRIGRAALSACVLGAVSSAVLAGACAQPGNRVAQSSTVRSTIAFVSTRHDPAADPADNTQRAFLATEIYLMDGDGTNPRRLTDNADADAFPALSPDGSRIVFESNRLRSAGDPFNRSDLFVMSIDGTGQTLLAHGGSATWSPDGKEIAFHASASGTGRPIKPDPGAATSDNDIFVLNVGDVPRNGARPRNITRSPDAIDDDPDWSPTGRRIVFTSHAVTDDPINSVTAEIYTIDADGTGTPTRLTSNTEEERAPAWSPDGRRIVFSCRRGGPDFEICVMNADGTGQVQLTDNSLPDLTASWSPDGTKIVFNRRVGARAQLQLILMNADGSGERQLTSPPGLNAFANWGEIRDRGGRK